MSLPSPTALDLAAINMDSPLAYARAGRQRDTVELVSNALLAGRIALAYQPIVRSAVPYKTAFYEGLVRIFDGQGRLIEAAKFIDAIETLELGRRIDCEALKLGLAALEETPTLRLAINMSARSIGFPAWRRVLQQGLAKDATVGERLILEITESSAMLMPDLIKSFMEEMQKKGICFALDDFGAGYTSFRYLRDLDFDILKIDGQFIQGIAHNPDNQVLTKALASIAKHFDMYTVAEFVETQEDARFLNSIGIDCLQGYFFAVPTVHPPWRDVVTQKMA